MQYLKVQHLIKLGKKAQILIMEPLCQYLGPPLSSSPPSLQFPHLRIRAAIWASAPFVAHLRRKSQTATPPPLVECLNFPPIQNSGRPSSEGEGGSAAGAAEGAAAAAEARFADSSCQGCLFLADFTENGTVFRSSHSLLCHYHFLRRGSQKLLHCGDGISGLNGCPIIPRRGKSLLRPRNPRVPQ